MAPTDPRQLAIAKASWDFSEQWVPENLALVSARARAAELECPVVSSGTGAALRLLAATLSASAIVEIGTGAGISAVWLLEGMAPDGVLTSIDSEAEYQIIAKEALAQAEINSSRVRLINGPIDEVLSRLSEAAYDMVLIAARVSDLEHHIERATGLLRKGGLLVIDRALWNDRVADLSARDAETMSMRTALASLSQSETFISVLLPVGSGLLVALKK